MPLPSLAQSLSLVQSPEETTPPPPDPFEVPPAPAELALTSPTLVNPQVPDAASAEAELELTEDPAAWAPPPP